MESFSPQETYSSKFNPNLVQPLDPKCKGVIDWSWISLVTTWMIINLTYNIITAKHMLRKPKNLTILVITRPTLKWGLLREFLTKSCYIPCHFSQKKKKFQVIISTRDLSSNYLYPNVSRKICPCITCSLGVSVSDTLTLNWWRDLLQVLLPLVLVYDWIAFMKWTYQSIRLSQVRALVQEVSSYQYLLFSRLWAICNCWKFEIVQKHSFDIDDSLCFECMQVYVCVVQLMEEWTKGARYIDEYLMAGGYGYGNIVS